MNRYNPSRRQFLGQIALGAVAAGTGLGLGGCNGDAAVSFRHGVASGDPLDDRVILWTRVTPSEPGNFEIA